MSYLRLTPAEYRAVCDCCRGRLPTGIGHEAFRRLLVRALAPTDPGLAAKLAVMGRARLGLLHGHFCPPRPSPFPAAPPPDFSPGELRVLAAASVAAPFNARFARPLRAMLIGTLRGQRPDLAGKLAGLTRRQFERLAERVRGLWEGSA